MAPSKTQPATTNDKVEAEENDLPERETYTAKQVATRIGTDAKTLRKFFRSAASTVEPVGQGGRYEFEATDLPKIREEFQKWNTSKTPRAAAGEKSPRKPRGRQAPKHVDLIEEDAEVLELDDDEIDDLEREPSDDELMDLDAEIDDLEDDEEEIA